ncbi:MAG: hypothetical protein JOZ25_01895 [Actinobacteria bacterium]|nr:hypothetical protein [Actinomycetota bacterium]
MGLRVARNLDLALLAIALPIFLAASWPMLGWGAGTAIYVAQRLVRDLVARRAAGSGDPRTVVGLLAGSMIGRGWLAAGAILGVGLIENDAGLAAAVLFLAAFTIALTTGLILRPLDRERG